MTGGAGAAARAESIGVPGVDRRRQRRRGGGRGRRASSSPKCAPGRARACCTRSPTASRATSRWIPAPTAMRPKSTRALETDPLKLARATRSSRSASQPSARRDRRRGARRDRRRAGGAPPRRRGPIRRRPTPTSRTRGPASGADELRAGGLRRAGRGDARAIASVVALGEDVGPRRHLRRSTAGCSRSSARRASSTRRSRRRRSWAPPSAWRSPACGRSSRCASSTSRCARSTSSSTRRRRTATCSAARAACRWSRACRSACGPASAAQHSQSLEAWFAHIPGLTVVAPATPADNYGLLHGALASRRPGRLPRAQGAVGPGRRSRAGRARAAGQGARRARRQRPHAGQLVEAPCTTCADAAARTRAQQGVVGRSDRPAHASGPGTATTVLGSAARTGALLVVHEAVQVGGFGAEIAAAAAEDTGCRVRRLGAPRIPVGLLANRWKTSRG